MSTPNPLVPEGSLQQSKGKSNVKIAFLAILAVHAVFLGGLLMLGCKEKPKVAVIEDPATVAATNDTAAFAPPPMDNSNLSTGSSMPTTTPAITTPTTTTAVVPTPTTPAVTTSATVATPIAPITPTAITPEAPVGGTKEYTIASGDTLGKIAKENHISLKTLLEANPNINPTRLQINQKIQIPAASATASVKTDGAAAEAPAKDENVYVVKPGDMLERIAKTHGTSVKAIKTANNLKTDRLKVGQKLKLPVAKTAATEVSAPVAESVLTPTPLTPSTTVASSKQ